MTTMLGFFGHFCWNFISFFVFFLVINIKGLLQQQFKRKFYKMLNGKISKVSCTCSLRWTDFWYIFFIFISCEFEKYQIFIDWVACDILFCPLVRVSHVYNVNLGALQWIQTLVFGATVLNTTYRILICIPGLNGVDWRAKGRTDPMPLSETARLRDHITTDSANSGFWWLLK